GRKNAAIDDAACTLPDPGKGKKRLIARHNAHWDLHTLHTFPLVKAIGDDQATTFIERFPESRTFVDSLCTRINHWAPTHPARALAFAVIDDRQDRLSRRDVVPRTVVERHVRQSKFGNDRLA